MSSARNFGLVVKGMSAGEELVACPFHSDSKPSAWFNPKKNLFWCAVCNIGLNAVQLAERLGVEYETDGEVEWEVEDYDLVAEDERFDLGIEYYAQYFVDRHIDAATISHYGVRWKAEGLQAAVLPLTNLLGVVQGVQHRYTEPNISGTRYKTFGEVPPVWPMPKLGMLREGQKVIVTEGAWSAMRLCSFGFASSHMVHAVALLGAKANVGIVDALRPFTPIFLYDGDKAGETACRKMRKLWPSAHCWTVSISPDDMTELQIGNLMTKIKEKVT